MTEKNSKNLKKYKLIYYDPVLLRSEIVIIEAKNIDEAIEKAKNYFIIFHDFTLEEIIDKNIKK